MFRFFVQKRVGNYFDLDSQTLAHIKVVRISQRPFICVWQGQFFETKLEGKRAVIIRELPANHEFARPVKLAAAVLKPKHFAWLVQKATELGVSELWPVQSEHVQHRPERTERLVKIAQSASQQAFRNYTLHVHNPINFQDALKIEARHKYILDEKLVQPIRTSFDQDCLFLVGPEGGWSSQELELAKASGFERIYLGPRIMRAETASLFVLARVKI